MIWEAGSEIGQLPASIETLDATGEFDLFKGKEGNKNRILFMMNMDCGSFRLVSRSGLRCLFIGPLMCDQSFFRCSICLARKSNQSGLSISKK